ASATSRSWTTSVSAAISASTSARSRTASPWKRCRRGRSTSGRAASSPAITPTGRRTPTIRCARRSSRRNESARRAQLATGAPHGDAQADKDCDQQRPVAQLREDRAIEPLRRANVENAFLLGGQTVDDTAERIDHFGDAGIGDANQRQTLLDGAQARVVGVLGEADRAIEPGIVGDIEDIGGLIDIAAEIARKHGLVADEG